MVVKCINHSFYVPLRKENAQDGEPIIWHTESMQRNKLYIQKEIAKKPAHSTLAPDGGGENLLKFLTTSPDPSSFIMKELINIYVKKVLKFSSCN